MESKGARSGKSGAKKRRKKGSKKSSRTSAPREEAAPHKEAAPLARAEDIAARWGVQPDAEPEAAALSPPAEAVPSHAADVRLQTGDAASLVERERDAPEADAPEDLAPASPPALQREPSAEVQDYEDDFEDYADDFEDSDNEAGAAPPGPKPTPTPAPTPALRPHPAASGRVEPAPRNAPSPDTARVPHAALQEVQEALAAENAMAKAYAKSRADSPQPEARKRRPLTATRAQAPAKPRAEAKAAPNPPVRSAKKKARKAAPPRRARDDSQALARLRSNDPRARRVRAVTDASNLCAETFVAFEQAPMSAFDLYSWRLRRGQASGTSASAEPIAGDAAAPGDLPTALYRQVAVQAFDENRSLDTQTDDIICLHKGVQFAHGDDTAFVEALQELQERRANPDAPRDPEWQRALDRACRPLGMEADETPGAVGGLARFIEAAGNAVEALLEELRDPGARASAEVKSRGEGGRTTVLESPPVQASAIGRGSALALSRHRRPSDCAWAPQPFRVAVAFPPGGEGLGYALEGGKEPEVDEDEELLPGRSIVTIADGWNPSPNLECLMGEGHVAAVALGTGAVGGQIVVAGTREGSLLAWDLREDPPAPAILAQLEALGLPTDARLPSYRTDVLGVGSSTHAAPLVALQVLDGQGGVAGTGAELRCQVVALDERGLMTVWNMATGSGPAKDDPCQAFGASLRFTRSRSLWLDAFGAAHPGVVGTTDLSLQLGGAGGLGGGYRCMSVAPRNPNRFVAGHAMGLAQGVRFGKAPAPRVFHTGDRHEPRMSFATPLAVTSVAVSPHLEDLVLSGDADGNVMLHRMDHSRPVRRWDAEVLASADKARRPPARSRLLEAAPVVAVRWSPSRPGVFFVLLFDGTLYTMDLLASDVTLPADVQVLEACKGDAVTMELVGVRRGRERQFVCVAYARGAVCAEIGATYTVASEDETACVEASLRAMCC